MTCSPPLKNKQTPLLNSIWIMDVYECNKYFMRWKMSLFYSTRHNWVEWKISSVTKWTICSITSNFQTNLNEKVMKNAFAQEKHYTSCRSNSTRENITRMAACVTLNIRTLPAAFVPLTVSDECFLVALFFEQTPKDCVGNTKYSI